MVRRTLRTLARLSRRRSSLVTLGSLAGLIAALYFGGRQVYAWNHFRQGEAELARSRPQPARRHFEAALRVWDDSATTHRLAARSARQQGDWDAARQHLLQCQRLEDPPSEEAVLEWALLEAEAGDLSRVESFLRGRAFSRHPSAVLIYEAMARAYLKRLRLAECMAIVDHWNRERPDDPVAHSLRGQLLTQLRVFGRAADEFAEAIRLDPDRDDDRQRMCLALIEVGRSEEALPHLRLLRQRRPDDRDLAVYLAFALGQTGGGAEAIQLLDEVLAQDPNHLPALAGHARIDLDAGRDAEAEHFARRVLALNPHHRQAAYLLHQSLVGQGRDEAAAVAKVRLQELDALLIRYYDIANRYLPQRPHDPDLMCELGRVLLGLGQAAEAEAWWSNALRLDPNHVPSHRALAEHYEKTGRPDKAREHRQLAGRSGK